MSESEAPALSFCEGRSSSVTLPCALRTGSSDYGLTPDAVARLVEGFSREGYGYADYTPAPWYGVSLVRPEVVTAMATDVGLVAAGHHVAGWDDHHDVYAFTR
jgi:hypothetical protein